MLAPDAPHPIVEIARFALAGGNPDLLFARAGRYLTSCGAGAAGVFELTRGDERRLVLRAGRGIEPGIVLPADATGDAAATVAVPGWDEPFGAIVAFARPGGTLPDGIEQRMTDLAELLGDALAHGQAREGLVAREWRLAEAQSMAQLGSYDWNIRTDTNIWSDELYRIYGTEPQSFNASYERFLGFVHPDDRDRIVAVHRKAYEDHQPYQMEERIVRPDGEVRILSSTGRVIADDAGTPVRMVGICMDVTERKLAEEELRRSAERFSALIDSAPDAVLVVGQDGTVQQANTEAERLFRSSWQEGRSIDDLLADIRLEPARGEFEALRADGTALPVDVSIGPIETGEGTVYAVFVRDATARRHAEAARLELHEAEMRRRQALEINDNVVQGLASLILALEAGRDDTALRIARGTLDSARHMMGDLLGGQVSPGELIRDRPAPSLLGPSVVEAPGIPAAASIRLIIADDADDIRLMLRMALAMHGFEVVGEASDGSEAVRVTASERPDVILLDLAMPGMDGLEAIGEIRRAAPDTRVVVLSGFSAMRMRQAAIGRGAHAYVEKGTETAVLADTIRALCVANPVTIRSAG